VQADTRQQRDGDPAHPSPEVAHGVGGDVAVPRARAPSRIAAPTIAANPISSASCSFGRWTATKTAAAAHAPTSTTLRIRPGPSGVRSPINAAIATSTTAAIASTTAAVAREVHGGRSRTSSRMLARSRGWIFFEAGSHGHSDRRKRRQVACVLPGGPVPRRRG